MEGSATTAARITLSVPKESAAGERRVALIPDAVKRYVAAGHTVFVQSGAGDGALIADDVYAAVGGTIVPTAADAFSRGDLILKVQKPTDEELAQIRPGAALVAFLQPMTNLDLV